MGGQRSGEKQSSKRSDKRTISFLGSLSGNLVGVTHPWKVGAGVAQPLKAFTRADLLELDKRAELQNENGPQIAISTLEARKSTMSLAEKPVTRNNFLQIRKPSRANKHVFVAEASAASSEASSSSKPILNKSNFPSTFEVVRRAALAGRPREHLVKKGGAEKRGGRGDPRGGSGR